MILRRTVTVLNPHGLHLRLASLFAHWAASFESKIEVVKDSERVDGKSVLGILALAAEHGTQLLIEAHGPDADFAIEKLASLFEQEFAENNAKGPEAPPS